MRRATSSASFNSPLVVATMRTPSIWLLFLAVSLVDACLICRNAGRPISRPASAWMVHEAQPLMLSRRGRATTLRQATDPETPDDSTARDEKEENPMSTAMIATIGFYKEIISPILPPACRFVPTCSQYGVQAIERFGPTRGVILIAWRLLRCSPVGGKGYDPPKWPPVAFTYSSY